MSRIIKRYHWRHYFGGASFLFIILQLISGVFLTLFYKPHLKEAYSSIQYLYNHFSLGSWTRDIHRWIAIFLFVAVLVHTIRSTLRKDFLRPDKRILWLTGFLLILPMMGFIVTGLILPWEWKAYWFMEMVPNYAGLIPAIGAPLKGFLIDAFTMPRDLIAHVLILPLISLILIDLHFLTKLRRRGVFRYIFRHTLIALPFLILIAFLAVYLPMPSQDPEIIPMPLDGTYIPAPEWFFLIFLLPLMYFKGFSVSFLAFYFPLIIFLALTFLPFYLKSKDKEMVSSSYRKKGILYAVKHSLDNLFGARFVKKGLTFLSVFLIVIALLGLFYLGSYESPTMGCSACHNTYSGIRMGVPPGIFKERDKIPLLDDNEWMMRHWFYPQVVW